MNKVNLLAISVITASMLLGGCSSSAKYTALKPAPRVNTIGTLNLKIATANQHAAATEQLTQILNDFGKQNYSQAEMNAQNMLASYGSLNNELAIRLHTVIALCSLAQGDISNFTRHANAIDALHSNTGMPSQTQLVLAIADNTNAVDQRLVKWVKANK